MTRAATVECRVDGRGNKQTAPPANQPSGGKPASAAKPPPAQLAILNEAQTAAFLGVSSRTLLKLRHEPWFPAPLQLGPRATRWIRDELIEALARQAPRGGVQAKPAHLVPAGSHAVETA